MISVHTIDPASIGVCGATDVYFRLINAPEIPLLASKSAAKQTSCYKEERKILLEECDFSVVHARGPKTLLITISESPQLPAWWPEGSAAQCETAFDWAAFFADQESISRTIMQAA